MASLHLARSAFSPTLSLRYTSLPRRRHFAGGAVRCRLQESGGGEYNGEEPTESLFMKELRRRGMAPTSLLEEEVEAKEEIDERRNKRSGMASVEYEQRISSQREKSTALNIEGIEGLVPRAKLLLSIGGTFILGFWPLMAVIIALFAALYFYFGPSCVHDGSKMPLTPTYIDPHTLLEDERLSQLTPNVN
ncbi:uncharacterized protein [Typha angustifolia]|uniref:uncharacterized protein isoform X1 n=1 Tax=Typha angustifolia TaxID=59011 RepID=UPI003C2CC684